MEYKLIKGHEYLFSDDGVNWVNKIFAKISDRGFHPFKYQTITGINFKHIKPLPERVLYTQSMKDSGEHIEVGMWFKFRGGEVKCLLPPDIHDRIIVNNDGYCIVASSAITPFPDPLELDDGEAYEFELNGYKSLGFYIKNRKSFFTKLLCGDKICGETECTNIKHLTVKESDNE